MQQKQNQQVQQILKPQQVKTLNLNISPPQKNKQQVQQILKQQQVKTPNLNVNTPLINQQQVLKRASIPRIRFTNQPIQIPTRQQINKQQRTITPNARFTDQQVMQIVGDQPLIPNTTYLRSLLVVAEGFLTGYQENGATILLRNKEEAKRLLSFFNNEYNHMKQGLSIQDRQNLEKLYENLYATSIAMDRVQVLKLQQKLSTDQAEKNKISQQIRKLRQLLPPEN